MPLCLFIRMNRKGCGAPFGKNRRHEVRNGSIPDGLNMIPRRYAAVSDDDMADQLRAQELITGAWDAITSYCVRHNMT